MKLKGVPDWLDSAVARDREFAVAKSQLSIAIKVLLVRAQDKEARLAVLGVEEAAHATIAAATDSAWRLGHRGRTRANLSRS